MSMETIFVISDAAAALAELCAGAKAAAAQVTAILGFKIAEEDLKLRGPGDFFGRRQHGLPALKIADLTCDMRLLKEAQGAALALLERDPELASCPTTAERVEAMFSGGEGTMN